MPKSVRTEFDINNLTLEEHDLLFGQPLKNTLEDKDRMAKERKREKKQTVKLIKDGKLAGDDDKDKKDKECNFLNGLVIQHNSTWKSYWDVFILILIGVSCLINAFT